MRDPLASQDARSTHMCGLGFELGRTKWRQGLALYLRSAGGAHHDFERLIRRVIRYFLTSESV